MGPRAKRRFAWAAAISGIVAVVVVAVVIHHATKSSSHTQQGAFGSENLGLIDGASQQRVLQRLGQPTSKQGRCWIYSALAGKYKGIYVGKYVDAVRFCFVGSVVSDIEDHWNLHDSKGPRWLAPVVISSGGSAP